MLMYRRMIVRTVPSASASSRGGGRAILFGWQTWGGCCCFSAFVMKDEKLLKVLRSIYFWNSKRLAMLHNQDLGY